MSHRNHQIPLSELLPTIINLSGNNIVIELGADTYTLDEGLFLDQHNVVIKGSGPGETILEIPEDIDYSDDAIINLRGAQDNEISVEISDLTIQTSVTNAQAQARAHKLTQESSYLIKCYHVKSMSMHNVIINVENIPTTCLDIRRGYDIDIRECVFRNFNRRKKGGCIWLRGEIENAVIEDNDIYKYGNDEAVCLFDTNNFAGVNDADEISKKNVNIRYNRFYCQDENGGNNTQAIIPEPGNIGNWNGCNQRFIAIFTNQETNKEYNALNEIVQRSTPCHQTLNGIHLENNEFHINAPVSHLVTIALDKYTTFKDIDIRNNLIDYGNWNMDYIQSEWKEMVDFCIFYDTKYDTDILDDYDSSSDEPIYITGNTINCSSHARNISSQNGVEYYRDNHMCVNIKGTKVIFEENFVKCTCEGYTSDERYYANKGIGLVYCNSKGGEIVFNNNRCEGLKYFMNFDGPGNNSTDRIPTIKVKGYGNYLQGNPRITYHNVLESHVTMIGNESICDYDIIFLSEFALYGTVIFAENRVYRDLSRVTDIPTPSGIIYYHSSGSTDDIVQSMKFICCNNIFDNIPSTLMYNYLQSSTMRVVHKNNVFTNLIE